MPFDFFFYCPFSPWPVTGKVNHCCGESVASQPALGSRLSWNDTRGIGGGRAMGNPRSALPTAFSLSPGHAIFKLTYLSNHDYKHLYFESDAATVNEIVLKVSAPPRPAPGVGCAGRLLPAGSPALLAPDEALGPALWKRSPAGEHLLPEPQRRSAALPRLQPKRGPLRLLPAPHSPAFIYPFYAPFLPFHLLSGAP